MAAEGEETVVIKQNILGGRKTAHVVFKYLSRSVLYKKRWGQAESHLPTFLTTNLFPS
jgi:hypothetical protein